MTTWHIHMPISALLRKSDKRLMETLTHPGGAAGARAELRQMLDAGRTNLVAGPCDNQNPDGSCAGHPDQER
ncbi:hypothetical protein R6258_07700 [Halomonas sp. HP20-15]|uniref:hypothetical protein n=1 Tax=Halomonas sp. HP20-15 TaxID=3085901 RepID=UPI002981EEE2|nr:hypothetical protein [Halomonas sp. HP20-15]MDW5376803.1 hypothetical protein [Halomonas sp. HP20-15]